MPFQKGNTINTGKVNNPKGRKGFEWEKSQLTKMSTLITNILMLADKIYEGTASKKEEKAFGLLNKFSGKVLDKLHASKQHNEFELPDNITEVKFHLISNKEDKKDYEQNHSTSNEGLSEELGEVPVEGQESDNK